LRAAIGGSSGPCEGRVLDAEHAGPALQVVGQALEYHVAFSSAGSFRVSEIWDSKERSVPGVARRRLGTTGHSSCDLASIHRSPVVLWGLWAAVVCGAGGAGSGHCLVQGS
jgi:hypothetical protein